MVNHHEVLHENPIDVAGQQLGSRWEQVGGAVGPVAQWVVVALIPLTIVALVLRHRRKASSAVA